MSGDSYPDVPSALLEIVPRSTLWLESIDTTVNHIYSVGGSQSGAVRIDRITVDTYAAGRDAARDEAEAVRQKLTSGYHDTTEGLLDRVEVEVLPHDLRFQHDTVSQFQAIYRVQTRPD